MEFALDRRLKQNPEIVLTNGDGANYEEKDSHNCTNGHVEDEKLTLISSYLCFQKCYKNKRYIFGIHIVFTLNDIHPQDSFPLLTTKQVYWKAVVEELLWFIKGSTNAKELAAKKVRIWDANGSRAFLDMQGLDEYEEGDLGPIYGFQWRHFGAEYKGMKVDYTGQGVDQLKYVIDTIRNDPNSRRIVMSSWNPLDIPKMALPPCHCMAQFYVCNGELSCQLYQRAGDMGLGVPFNIASYALLLRMVAHVTGLKPGDFVHTQGDTHVYSNHLDGLKEQILMASLEISFRLGPGMKLFQRQRTVGLAHQIPSILRCAEVRFWQLTRKPRSFPKLRFKRPIANIDEFTADDIELIGYNPYPKIPLPMAL